MAGRLWPTGAMGLEKNLWPADGGIPESNIGFSPPFNSSEPVCTNALLRCFYKKYHRYPEEGTWAEDLSSFQPALCHYAPVDVGKCLLSRSSSSIFILGDSQGRHYFRALILLLTSSGISCAAIDNAADGAKPEEWDKQVKAAKNSSITDPMKRVLLMGCSTCQSTTALCRSQDRSLQISYKSNWKLRTEYVAPLLQKHYLLLEKRYAPPDVFIYFLPLQHVKNQGSIEGAGGPQIHHIVEVVKNNTDNRTGVYFMGTPGEVEDCKDSYWKNKLFEGLLASQKLYLLTRRMFSEVKDLLTMKDGHVYGFFNLVNMSAPRTAWGTDGVHYKEVWYEHVMKNLMSQHCYSQSREVT